ncbi:hypothetical protein KXV92_004864 [Aspergillus fumigatus]|nr:hypothetical protein KXW88_001678 [Aspergillus fumigatus]KAH3188472.1 hypothetical protein KXV92_004864 [Aspergillus fumigatus]
MPLSIQEVGGEASPILCHLGRSGKEFKYLHGDGFHLPVFTYWLPQAGLRVARDLPRFYFSSWEDTPGHSDTGARPSGLVLLRSQRAQIASEHAASQEDTLSEAETLVRDDASLRSAEQGEEWRYAGAEPERDAAVHTTSQRTVSRWMTSLNTPMGHRTLRGLAGPPVFSIGGGAL